MTTVNLSGIGVNELFIVVFRGSSTRCMRIRVCMVVICLVCVKVRVSR